jgi:hypothetical protein
MRLLSGNVWPSRRDGNAVVSVVLAGVACAVAGATGLWLWRAYPTTFWVVAAGAVVAGVCLAAAGTATGIRARDGEARQHRAERTQERFLQQMRDGVEPRAGGVT